MGIPLGERDRAVPEQVLDDAQRDVSLGLFRFPADIVEAMDLAKQTHGVVWSRVVLDAIKAELARLQRRTPKPR